jgi:uncharacterized protein (TIGR00299 family) protein
MHIHLDLLGGLAGDMFLAAAIDAGLVDIDALTSALRTLGLGEAITIETEHVRRGAIAGTHVRFANWDPDADADHRHLTTIERMIAESGLPEAVKTRATQLFRVLGEAEAAIHDMTLEEVHFHEVGAVDSILDFVSAAWIIEHVDATWSIGEVPTGKGEIKTAHGTIPVPAPATARLLRGFSIVQRDVQAELVTPTGAAILAGLGAETASKTGNLAAVGYGCGTRELGELSNVVRMMAFDTAAAHVLPVERDRVARIACEIDDMQPELLAWVCDERLPQVGALDVSRTAVQMKKGRLATRIEVLAPVARQAEIIDLVLRETTTLGVRVEEIDRVKLPRRQATVTTPWGEVDVKIAELGAGEVKVAPEFDSCAALAAEAGVPIERVWSAARRAAEEE